MHEKNNEYEKYDDFFKSQISLNSDKTHKFFERQLDNDLVDLASFLQVQYDRIEKGEILQNDRNEKTIWDNAGSITTSKWNKYNAFQFYHPGIHKLFKSVRSMVVEACEHYEIDFEKEEFWAQAWFNINYNHIGKLDWHEHGGRGAPWFHGYYAVKAEPSITHYNIFDNIIENNNKDNRAILSETGHPHAMGDWDWEGPRITIAYDVVPFRGVMQGWEQHWIPLG